MIIRDIEPIVDLLGNKHFKKLFRVNFKGFRLYIEPEPFQYYSGLTGALGSATFKGDPAEKRLKNWRESFIDSMGKDAADNYVDLTADFGTLLHMALVTIKEERQINWAEEKEKAEEYFINAYMKKGMEPDHYVINKMVYEYQKHVGSLMQFIYERVHSIHAIEVPATWEAMRIATPIDLVCDCRPTPKGEFVRTTINMKTSNQITPHHLIQASCELMMWNETYQNLEAENTAILRTMGKWREKSGPNFDFKYLNIDDAIKKAALSMDQLSLCLRTEASYLPEPRYRSFDGITKMGDQPVIKEYGIEEDWGDWWREKQEQDEE